MQGAYLADSFRNNSLNFFTTSTSNCKLDVPFNVPTICICNKPFFPPFTVALPDDTPFSENTVFPCALDFGRGRIGIELAKSTTDILVA